MVPAVLRVGEKLRELEIAILHNRIKNGSKIMKGIVEAHLDLYEYDREGIRIIQAFLQGYLFPGMSKKTRENLNDLARNNFQTLSRIINLGKGRGFLKKAVNEFLLADTIWSLFIGVFQVEENKMRFTKKNYFYPTMEYGFSLITQSSCPESPK